MQERSEVILERRTRTAGEEWFMSADDILDKNVINPQGDDLGEISDMRVSFPEGKVQYLVLKYGGMLGVGAKRFAIPPEAVIYRPGDDNFVVNIDKQRLDDERGFDEDNWPREADFEPDPVGGGDDTPEPGGGGGHEAAGDSPARGHHD